MNCKNMPVWNVHDLNSGTHRDIVRELVVVEHPSFVRLQETKLVVISNFDAIEIMGFATSIPISQLSVHGAASWSRGDLSSGQSHIFAPVPTPPLLMSDF